MADVRLHVGNGVARLARAWLATRDQWVIEDNVPARHGRYIYKALLPTALVLAIGRRSRWLVGRVVVEGHRIDAQFVVARYPHPLRDPLVQVGQEPRG